ncbi:MAG: hypothetical protein AB1733_11335, partial [Thermodesulfobacteriota bacterium]
TLIAHLPEPPNLPENFSLVASFLGPSPKKSPNHKKNGAEGQFEDFRGLLYALSFETGPQEGLELWRRANKRFYGAGFLAVAQWHDEQGFKKD